MLPYSIATKHLLQPCGVKFIYARTQAHIYKKTGLPLTLVFDSFGPTETINKVPFCVTS